MKAATFLMIPALLGGALLAVVSLRAASDAGEAAGRGRAHVEKSCLRCHAGAQLDALVRRKAADRPLPDALDAFLTGHHAADAALRADVLAELARRLATATDS